MTYVNAKLNKGSAGTGGGGGTTAQEKQNIGRNNLKVGITPGEKAAIVLNTAKVGITPEEKSAIILNTAKGSGSGGGVAGVSSVNTRAGAVVLTKADVGLANVDNTNDVSKPISTAAQTALDLKTDSTTTDTNTAAIAINTAKPTGATATQAAAIGLNTLKVGITAGEKAAIILNTAKGSGSGGTAGVSSVNTRSGAVVLTKADVGLANVDNTNDVSKPISTATQTALDLKTDSSTTDTNTTAIAVNTLKVGITAGEKAAIIANTAKPTGATATQAAAIGLNTLKVGITAGEKAAIVLNTAKGSGGSGGGVPEKIVSGDNTASVKTAEMKTGGSNMTVDGVFQISQAENGYMQLTNLGTLTAPEIALKISDHVKTKIDDFGRKKATQTGAIDAYLTIYKGPADQTLSLDSDAPQGSVFRVLNNATVPVNVNVTGTATIIGFSGSYVIKAQGDSVTFIKHSGSKYSILNIFAKNVDSVGTEYKITTTVADALSPPGIRGLDGGIQLQHETRVYKQWANQIERVSSWIHEIRAFFSTNLITSTRKLSRVKNTIRMALPNQKLTVEGAAHLGQEIHAVRIGGEPFSLKPDGGGEIHGYPYGLWFGTDGDSVKLWQLDASKWMIVGGSFTQNSVRDLSNSNSDFRLGLNNFTTQKGSGFGSASAMYINNDDLLGRSLYIQNQARSLVDAPSNLANISGLASYDQVRSVVPFADVSEYGQRMKVEFDSRINSLNAESATLGVHAGVCVYNNVTGVIYDKYNLDGTPFNSTKFLGRTPSSTEIFNHTFEFDLTGNSRSEIGFMVFMKHKHSAPRSMNISFNHFKFSSQAKISTGTLNSPVGGRFYRTGSTDQTVANNVLTTVILDSEFTGSKNDILHQGGGRFVIAETGFYWTAAKGSFDPGAWVNGSHAQLDVMKTNTTATEVITFGVRHGFPAFNGIANMIALPELHYFVKGDNIYIDVRQTSGSPKIISANAANRTSLTITRDQRF